MNIYRLDELEGSCYIEVKEHIGFIFTSSETDFIDA